MKKFYFLMALVLCAFTANALDTKNSNVYFDGTGWTSKVVQLMFGKQDGSAGCAMTKIANTSLYYLKTPQWDGYTQFCVLGADAEWGWEGGSNYPLANRKNWGLESTPILNDYELKENETNFFAVNGQSLNGSWLGGGYAELNKTQKVEVHLDGDNLSGEATISSYKLSAASATTAVSGTEIAAAQTATVTCVATVEDGTCFEGWYEGETLVSENATYTYVVTGEKTLIAKFAYDPVTAIESVEAASAAVEYYNLQGVKVANPENGIFIKKQGNKVSKVIL